MRVFWFDYRGFYACFKWVINGQWLEDFLVSSVYDNKIHIIVQQAWVSETDPHLNFCVIANLLVSACAWVRFPLTLILTYINKNEILLFPLSYLFSESQSHNYHHVSRDSASKHRGPQTKRNFFKKQFKKCLIKFISF